jgi:hypothetical protein
VNTYIIASLRAKQSFEDSGQTKSERSPNIRQLPDLGGPFGLGLVQYGELILYTDCMPDPRCTASASDQNVQKNVMVFGPMTDVGVSKKGRIRGSLDINQLYASTLD